jgi:hypothetical protein
MTSRQLLTPLVTVAAMTLAGSGCQSCSHSMDYSSPVANCQCGTCGETCGGTCGVGQRAGSAGGYGSYGGYVEGPGVESPTYCEGCNQ